MYVKRLERLEQIAGDHEGVEKVFAMQAGREIRVMVKPERIDDIQAQVIAREIAKKVEDELDLPGPDPHHRGARVPRHGVRPLTLRLL